MKHKLVVKKHNHLSFICNGAPDQLYLTDGQVNNSLNYPPEENRSKIYTQKESSKLKG